MAKGKRRKTPKQLPEDLAPTERTKKPFPSAPSDTDNHQHVSWRISMLDVEGPFGWANVSLAKIAALKTKLSHLEAGKWATVTGANTGHKEIPVENLCREAKQRLEHLKLDDLVALWELRMGSKERVWGIRHDHVFYLLWWDPDHAVCPSKKRHT